jgi:hypothetical protein
MTSTRPVPIRFARSVLREHRHVCAFFTSPAEEYETLLPFISEGIRNGERASHVLPAKYQEEHLAQLSDAGIDVAAAQSSDQLHLAVPEETYLRGGRFDKSAMLALIQEELRAGKKLGFPLTRMIAHAETVLEDWSNVNDWVEYEIRLNEVLPSYDDPVICTYDANLLDGSLTVDILRTHPVVVVGGVLIENSFFSRPNEFLREVRGRSAAQPAPYRA